MDEAVEHKMLNDPDFIEYATKLIEKHKRIALKAIQTGIRRRLRIL